MAFIIKEIVGETSQWALWKVEETIEDLQQNLIFSPFDFVEFAQITHDTRKLEWLAARKAMQSLVQDAGYQYKGIVKEANGKSFLHENKLEISISHTKGYAAVMINSLKEAGIDIELLKDKIEKIAFKFISKEEFKFIQKDKYKLTVSWCAKEAIYKYLGMPGVSFIEHIILDDFQIRDKGLLTAKVVHPDLKESVTLEYILQHNYAIAYTL